MLEELACGEGILAAGTGMHYQRMPVCGAALQAQNSSTEALLCLLLYRNCRSACLCRTILLLISSIDC